VHRPTGKISSRPTNYHPLFYVFRVDSRDKRGEESRRHRASGFLFVIAKRRESRANARWFM
jgi:hypothetical protein